MGWLLGLFTKVLSWLGPLLIDRLISALKNYYEKRRLEKEKAAKLALEIAEKKAALQEAMKNGSASEQEKAFEDLFNKHK